MKQGENLKIEAVRNVIEWPRYKSKSFYVRFGEGPEGPLSCYVKFWGTEDRWHELPLGKFLDGGFEDEYWVEDWEVLFNILLLDDGATCDMKCLRIVAASGVPIARERGNWPLFRFSFERVKKFCNRLPLDARREYLLYCNKEWNQRSSKVQQTHLLTATNESTVFDGIAFPDGDDLKPDFGKACEAELDFVIMQLQKIPPTETEESVRSTEPRAPAFWNGSFSDFVYIHDELRKAGYIIEGSDDLLAQHYTLVRVEGDKLIAKRTSGRSIKQRRTESKPGAPSKRYTPSNRASQISKTLIEELKSKKQRK